MPIGALSEYWVHHSIDINIEWLVLGWALGRIWSIWTFSHLWCGVRRCTGHGRMGTSISGLQLVIRLKVKAIQVVGNREQRPAAAIIGIIRWKLFSSGVRNGLWNEWAVAALGPNLSHQDNCIRSTSNSLQLLTTSPVHCCTCHSKQASTLLASALLAVS